MRAGILAGLARGTVRLLDLPGRMLRPEALLHGAGAAEALAAWAGETPLLTLVEDYRRHAELTLPGCFAARFDLSRLLRNLAALHAREIREPALLASPVERPVFITGLPRSGTTFLHKLLAEDEENRSPAVWETVFPLPRGRKDPPARRIATVNRQLAAFARMAPGFRAVHPIDAESPQECSEITAHILRSFRFETTHWTPGYRAWIRAADHEPAYRFHRRFLQHLQHMDGRPRRWVLKCPDHVFTLGALRAVYPDARLVFLHRDPAEVLASVAGLTAILRAPFTAGLDREAIGRQVLEDWVAGAEAMVRARAERLFPEGQVVHLGYSALVADPLGTVEALYGRFGLPLDGAVRDRMARRIAAMPRGGYGGLRHRLEDYGIAMGEVRERFAAYTACFGVGAERAVMADAAAAV